MTIATTPPVRKVPRGAPDGPEAPGVAVPGPVRRAQDPAPRRQVVIAIFRTPSR